MSWRLGGLCALVVVLSLTFACDGSSAPPASSDAATSTAPKDTAGAKPDTAGTDGSGPLDGSRALDSGDDVALVDGAETAAGDTAPDAQAAPNPPGCPEDDPTDGAQGACSTPGLQCVYPATGCPLGSKPDNTVRCSANGQWSLSQPFHHCSTLGASPPHRPEAPVCEPAPVAPAPCTASGMGSHESTCTTAAECVAGQVCLDVVKFGDQTACECFEPGCTSDADCGADEACVCGAVATEGMNPCGAWTGKPCGSQCVPADCRTDGDCGEGKMCSPSKDECGWEIESLHCHDAAADACLSDLECEISEQCRFTPEKGWHCDSPPMCM